LKVNHEEFLEEWFGVVGGREVGTPKRRFVESYMDLITLIEECRLKRLPCFLSVQPYRARDQPCAIEKLFFEFDCAEDPEGAWRDACALAEALRRFYGAEPLMAFSGRRGYHVYAFLTRPVTFEPERLELAKRAYRELQLRILEGLSLPTLDPSAVGDLKRLARCPFSLHEETGSPCTPVTPERRPFTPKDLDAYRSLDADLLTPIIKELRAKDALLKALPRRLPEKLEEGRVRPCILAALEAQLDGGSGHLMRLAIAREFLAAGCSVDEIVPLFKGQADFSPERTRYYVEHAARNPVKPFKCETIRRLGFCLPSCGRWRGCLEAPRR
jgi:hypothetical protein